MVALLFGAFGPLWWLWIVAPLLVAFVYVLASKDDPRRARELERWRKSFGPAVADDGPKDASPSPPPRVSSLPNALNRALREFAGGAVKEHYELVPKLAYLSVVGADAEQSSDFQAVVAKLESRGPAFILRPIALVEGVPQPNTGVPFPKDAEFAELFQVDVATLGDGAVAPGGAVKAIRKWLSQPVRDALKEMPEAWLRVDGASMVLAYFGDAEASDLNKLVLAADTVFAEHGAGGGPSLFGEEDEDDARAEEKAPAPKPKPA